MHINIVIYIEHQDLKTTKDLLKAENPPAKRASIGLSKSSPTKYVSK